MSPEIPLAMKVFLFYFSVHIKKLNLRDSGVDKFPSVSQYTSLIELEISGINHLLLDKNFQKAQEQIDSNRKIYRLALPEQPFYYTHSPRLDSNSKSSFSDSISYLKKHPPEFISDRMDQTVITENRGKPLCLFPKNYQPPEDVDIHQAVRMALQKEWAGEEKMMKIFIDDIEEHINLAYPALDGNSYGLTKDEFGAIVYYTSDIRFIVNRHRKMQQNLYFCLNKLLAMREVNELDNWLPFLHFLLTALHKFPSHTSTVYRGISENLLDLKNCQYKTGREIVWVALSSTSESLDTMKQFTREKGSWFIINTIEGKEISQYSRSPNEHEVLLLPNSYFEILSVNDPQKRAELDVPDSYQLIEMQQKITPLKFLNMEVQDID